MLTHKLQLAGECSRRCSRSDVDYRAASLRRPESIHVLWLPSSRPSDHKLPDTCLHTTQCCLTAIVNHSLAICYYYLLIFASYANE